jgi:UDP-N-acetylglucosamine 2-epimerase (non-hydrolysing)
MAERKLKVVTIIGTRPEIIRLARVMALLDEQTTQIIAHTGQNYDYELNEIFFRDLGLRKPDRFMNVDTSSIGAVYGNVLIESEKVFRDEKPDAVVILGDTNSSIAGIVARRMKIPIYHMEAGNRCFDLNVPEETNRRIIDHVSDFNLVYTEHARRNLLREGIHPRRIYLTGSPMKEVLTHSMAGIRGSKALDELSLTAREYYLVSMHREENVDFPAHLAMLVEALNRLAAKSGLPVVVSTHPRTRKRLEQLADTPIHAGVRFMKPFGFLDYNWLQMNARCVISDSGTISEESAILRFPAVTIRTASERPEGLDAGTIIMTGLNPDTILRSVAMVEADRDAIERAAIPFEYEIENVSQRVVRLIQGTAGEISHRWDGIIKLQGQ